jgi:hypothetical protein
MLIILDMRARVLLKRVRNKDQDDIRSNIFKTAVPTGDVELISVLAERADVSRT